MRLNCQDPRILLDTVISGLSTSGQIKLITALRIVVQLIQLSINLPIYMSTVWKPCFNLYVPTIMHEKAFEYIQAF